MQFFSRSRPGPAKTQLWRYASVFERMKQLVGSWEGYRHGNEERKVSFTYRLTGGKAALVEDYCGSGTPALKNLKKVVFPSQAISADWPLD